jgi:hypothetical protein
MDSVYYADDYESEGVIEEQDDFDADEADVTM